MDEQIIHAFRNAVNYADWIFFRYVNINNRNQWNLICSAMDWIEVSVQYMNSHPLVKLHSNQSIEFFSYLACIDVVVEAIEQLHRVFYATDKRVFEKDKDCFQKNPFGQNDRDHFKTIRSCFGAHPINLDEPTKPQNKDMRRYASWSVGGAFAEGDYQVVLYSNKPGEDNIIFCVYYSQINFFANKYYAHLNTLRTKIEVEYSTFCAEMRNKVFECNGDPVTRLRILKAENKKRLNNDYYATTIDDLLLCFETQITNQANREMVSNYQDSLLSIIDEIQNNLQNMTLNDLSIDTAPKPKDIDYPLKPGWRYWVEKLNDARSGYGYPECYWVGKIEELFRGQFVFEYVDWQELYVLVMASLHQIRKEGI